MRVIAYTLFGSLTEEEVGEIRDAITAYNASRVWTGCPGVVLDRTGYDDTTLSETPSENFLWPILATASVPYKVLADEAAIVRFWLSYTAKQDLRLKVKLRDHHSGVLYGIPRVIMDGEMEVDIAEEEIDVLLKPYPEPHRKMLEEVFIDAYKKAARGEWENVWDEVHRVSLRTDGRLVYQLEARFGNLQQAIADAIRGLAAILKKTSVEVQNHFTHRDVSLELAIPADIWRSVTETADALKVTPQEFINLAMNYTLERSW